MASRLRFSPWQIYTSIVSVLLILFSVVYLAGHQTDHSETAATTDTTTGSDPCAYNTKDRCVFSPAIDFWPSGSEGATNPSYEAVPKGVVKEIGGVITASSQNVITIHTTSGRNFTVTYPDDEINWWNQTRSQLYGNYKIGVGDTLMITYDEQQKASTTTIAASQIFSSRFAIKESGSKANPKAPIKRYESPQTK